MAVCELGNDSLCWLEHMLCIHSQLHAVTCGDTARKRGTHRVWAKNKKQTFLELEWKLQHYLAAMSLFQTLVQEEPSHIWGNLKGIWGNIWICVLFSSLVSFCPLQSHHNPVQSISTVPRPLALTHSGGLQSLCGNLGAKLLLRRSRGVFCCCTSEPWWPL